jgi:hypothetical protein
VIVFRLLLVAFGLAVLFFATRFVVTADRRYLRRALWLLAAALVSGVLFFSVLLISQLA